MTALLPILLLPFLGTTFGAGTVLFLKNQLNRNSLNISALNC